MTIGDQLAAQQRERQAQAAEWEKRREAGRAWAYFRAGQPVPVGDATDAPREETRTVKCFACEDRPQTPNDPCAVCGMRADATDATPTVMPDGLEASRPMGRPWTPPEPAVIARARALIEADHDRWVAIDKADLAELVALAVAP